MSERGEEKGRERRVKSEADGEWEEAKQRRNSHSGRVMLP